MALSEEQARLASDLLVKHWTEGSCLATLPERLRPSTRAEGYAIQAFLERHSAPAAVRLEDCGDQPRWAAAHRGGWTSGRTFACRARLRKTGRSFR